MPLTRHQEKHFTASDKIRDVIIGMSDGLTVPFALAAGVSAASGSAHLVVIAGLAEIAAGSISMGLGGYLAAKSDTDHYVSELAREKVEIKEVPTEEKREVDGILRSYGLTAEESAPVVEALSQKPQAWADFMMRFELGLEKPDPKRALTSALTIALSYAAGGFIPLLPYIVSPNLHAAFLLSVLMTLIALTIFGYMKGYFLGVNAIKSAFQTALIGGVAAAVAFLIARVIA